MAIRVDDPRDIQSAYDERFNTANDLKSAETTGTDPYVIGGLDQLDAYRNDPANSVREEEESPTGDYINRFTGKLKPVKSAGKLAKVGGPTGIIIAVLLGIAGVVSFFGGPGLLIVNLAEVMTEKFNYQLGSMEVRHQKILYAKLNNSTTGKCGTVVNINCKYTTFSDREIDNFKKAGIEVKTDGKSVLGRNKVKSFTVEGRTVTARNFTSEMAANSKFNTAMKRAYNMKYAGMSDKIFNSVAKKFGISKKAPFEEGSDDKKRATTIEEDTKEGRASTDSTASCKDPNNCTEEENARKKAGADGADEANKLTSSSSDSATNQADNIIAENADDLARGASGATGEITDEAMEIASKSVGGAAASIIKITGPIDNACMIYGWTKTISYVAKTVRSVQMVRYAMIFLSTASMIKAGHARAEDVRYLGDIITKVVSINGKKTKAGTDSFGYRYAAFGDKGIDDAASTAVAGASFGGTIQSIVSTLLSPLGGKDSADKTCKILGNPIVQVGSAIVGIASFFVGAGEVKLTAQLAIAPLIAIVGAILPAMIGEMLAGKLVGDNTYGERSVNLITSGSGGMLSKVASSGGNSIMHKKDAVAYMQVQKQVLAEYAEYDRSTHSPFDASNPNTFLGSIFTRFAPYLYGVNNAPDAISNTLGVVSSIASNFLSPAANAASPETFDECKDADYLYHDIATDPFCNPVVGIPPQYLGVDPADLTERMASKGMIDQMTGEPLSEDYKSFVTECITREDPYGTSKDGEEDKTADCFIDSQEKADMYLHFIDQRALDINENGLPDAASESTNTPSTGGGDSTTCAEGTIDMGMYDNAHDDGTKQSIKLCALPNLPAPGYATSPYYSSIKATDPGQQAAATGKALVNARASGDAYQMIEAAIKDGVNLKVEGSSAFRSYEHQVELRDQWCAKGDCSGAAKPGYSNHEMGLAIDFDLPGTAHSATRNASKELRWLRANANKFGYDDTVMPKEDWHWAYTKKDTSNPPSKDGWSVPINNGGKTSLLWHQQASKGLHKGIDFPAPSGTPVTAAHDGKVTMVRNMGSCGYATAITAEGVDGIWHAYQHMNPIVKEGDTVKRGQVIGRVGTFCGSGYHLHFSIETANRVSAYADSGAKDTSKDPKGYIPL